MNKVLTDDAVLDLRRRIRAGEDIVTRKWAEEYGTDKSKVDRAIRGRTFMHLDAIEPPVIRIVKKEELKLKAREMYTQGMTYPQIKKELGVSKSSISLWCRDLVEEKIIKLKDHDKHIPIRGKPMEAREIKKKKGTPVGEKPFEEYKIYAAGNSNVTHQYRLVHMITGRQRYLSMGKYLMAVKLGREILSSEHVDFKGGDPKDIDNYELKNERDLKAQIPCKHCGTLFRKTKNRKATCSNTCTRRLNGTSGKATVFRNECAICGDLFKTTVKDKDICMSRSCRDVVKEANEFERLHS
jgi:hypothetical protein